MRSVGQKLLKSGFEKPLPPGFYRLNRGLHKKSDESKPVINVHFCCSMPGVSGAAKPGKTTVGQRNIPTKH
jgi:hypothetical protein